MSRETVITTIRHGKTAYNAERRYAGRIDVPLSEEGECEVRKAASGLDGAAFDVVITSRLQRSWQTARLLVSGSVPIIRSKLCNERCFGVLEGVTWEDVQRLQPPVLLIRVGDDLHTVNPPGAEPFEEVWARARAFRRYLFGRHPGKRILVVSHGVFLQLFHGLLRGLNCIESLGTYPGALEMATFEFRGEQLVRESVLKLGESEAIRW